MIICAITLSKSIIDIYKWGNDSKKISKEVEEIEEIVQVEEIIEETNENEIEIVEQKEEIPKANPYWDYIKMNLINVDFKELKSKNSDTKGWIKVNGTSINYPFVQAKDNNYYLTHSFNKSYNRAGWVFLDYRNNINELDKNTIIYGHGRMDRIMFSSLKTILTNGWLKDTNNYIVKLSTETHNTLWQAFSVYHIKTTNDYLKINFKTDDQFLNFANMLKERSSFDFKTNIQETDKILTLSTCYSEKERVVLHAKLIKSELK